MIGIGVMSGSSLDGLDVSVVSFGESQKLAWKLLNSQTFAIPKKLSHQLKTITDQKPFELVKTQNLFTQFTAQSVHAFIDSCSSEIKNAIDYVAVHGHTVLHSIEQNFSWQLLNGGQLCALINRDVVCDFRNQDMALGGQGTPMAVLADRDLFEGYSYYYNLGGIANVSYKHEGNWTAYDISPCNQILNFFAQREGHDYDKDGKLSEQGSINNTLLNKMLLDEYIQSPPPKSLDNTWIKENWIKKMLSFELSNVDYLRTYVEFIAKLINDIVDENSKILLSGGGTKNAFLLERVKALAKAKTDFIVPPKSTIDYKEAILIAYAGYKRFMKETNFIASATGAARDTIGGALYLSKNI